eukprot:tig00000157_g9716.t1
MEDDRAAALTAGDDAVSGSAQAPRHPLPLARVPPRAAAPSPPRAVAPPLRSVATGRQVKSIGQPGGLSGAGASADLAHARRRFSGAGAALAGAGPRLPVILCPGGPPRDRRGPAEGSARAAPAPAPPRPSSSPALGQVLPPTSARFPALGQGPPA